MITMYKIYMQKGIQKYYMLKCSTSLDEGISSF